MDSVSVNDFSRLPKRTYKMISLVAVLGLLLTLFPAVPAMANDTTAPTVKATDPGGGATGIPVDKVITVTFSEDVVEGNSFGQIALTDAANNPVECNVTLSGNVLTIDPSANLAYGTYTVTIPASAVKDLAGNALEADYTFSFTTLERSTYKLTYSGLAEIYPVRNLVDVTGKSQEEINQIVENAIALEGLEPIEVTLATDLLGAKGYNAVRFLPINAGEHIQLWAEDTAGNWYDINKVGWGSQAGFELPANYSATTNVYLLADAEGSYMLNVELMDLEANKVIVKASATVYVDGTAPSVIGPTDPENNATNVPVNKTITVNFSEDVVQGVNFNKIVLTDATGNMVACNMTLSGKVLTIDPIENLAYSTTYTVVIPAGAVKDLVGNALAEGYTFSFTTAADNTPPGEVTILDVHPFGCGSFMLEFTLPSDTDLASVKIYCARSGSSVWEEVYAPSSPLQPGTGAYAMVSVPPLYVLGSDRVQFKVSTVDTWGNESKGTIADNGGQGYLVAAYYPLQPGPAGWRTFSVPVQLAGGQKLLGDVIDPGKVEIALKYDATTQQWVQVTEENNTIRPLEAVYIKLKDYVSAVIVPATDPTGPPVRDLAEGWNLVGFTQVDSVGNALYSVRGKWSVIVSPSVNGTWWAVTPESWNPYVILYEGYWVYMDEPGKLAGVSTTPVTVATYRYQLERSAW